ncbi:MAG: exonuclease domain-containing protein, partial [Thermomicrobiales bacterium]
MDHVEQDIGGTNAEHPAAHGGVAFQNLALRAEAFVAEQGGRASEDLLISHVFGSTGSPTLWRPLLREVLAHYEGLTLRGDGAWLLADGQPEPADHPLADFVVLDVETTGLQPSRQRIIEIAIARFGGGVLQNVWESLCNPGRRVPSYIVKLTGIDDDLLSDAPTFDTIADAAVDLLAGAVVVGHNVEFDLSFLNEELKRAGRVPVVNDRVDTLTLAMKLLPGLRKPTLDVLAERLGAAGSSRTRHRAGPDASVTGAVAVALVAQAWDAGYRTLDDLKALARPATRRPKERMPRASSVVDRSVLATIPKAPGVYLMRDANER